MARRVSKTAPATNGNGTGPDYRFVPIHLSYDQEQLIGEKVAGTDISPVQMWCEFLDSGWKLSGKWSDKFDCYFLSVTAPQEHDHYSSVCFSLRCKTADMGLRVLYEYWQNFIIPEAISLPDRGGLDF